MVVAAVLLKAAAEADTGRARPPPGGGALQQQPSSPGAEGDLTALENQAPEASKTFSCMVTKQTEAAAHLVGPLHGDGEVVLSPGVPALADEHLVTDAARLPSLLGVEFSTNHLGANVPGFFRPGAGRQELGSASGSAKQKYTPAAVDRLESRRPRLPAGLRPARS